MDILFAFMAGVVVTLALEVLAAWLAKRAAERTLNR